MKKIILGIIVRGLISATILFLGRPWQHAVPVSLSYRNARFDDSMVAQIHNNSNSRRKVEIEISSPTTGERLRRIEIIPRWGTVEIGWLEGWRLVSTEKLRIHQYGYRDVSETVPSTL